MKRLLSAGTLIALGLVFAAGGLVAEDKTPPEKVTFEAKPGPVTFDHAKHIEAVKQDCKACHVALFPRAKAPLGYKESMHKKAEAGKTSCGACRAADGMAFESKGNRQKCRLKRPA